VANLSFAMNYALAPATPGPAPGDAVTPGGPSAIAPGPFHAGNLIIHLLAAITLFGVVRRTLLAPRLRPTFERAAPWIACAVALVWVVHPLTTAAVTYVVQRVESLMSLFYLLTLYCAIRASGAGRTGWWTAAAVVNCALGMATKEVMVTAPLMAAVWWWLFVPAGGRESRRRGWTLLAGLFATWAVLAFLISGERRGPSLSMAWDTSWAYLLAQAEIVVHYLRLAIIPTPLVFLYDWPLVHSLGAVAWQAAVLVALVALTAAGLVRRHPASFLGAWFFLILAPSSSVLPIVTEVAAEHRMYLPLAAIVAGVVIAAFLLGRRVVPSPKAGAAIATIVLVGWAGVLAGGTRQRSRVYWSAESLWGDTVAKRPNDARPRVAYAEALADAGRLADAEAQLRVAIQLAPDDPFARVRLGGILAQQRRLDEALPQLERAVALRPDDPDAHRLLAEVEAARGQDLAAVGHLERALAAAPGDPRLMARLALLLAGSQDPLVRNVARARELAREAVRLTGGRDPRMLGVLSAAEAAR
jgi:tetratricopeptide (TPR) repeat protein